MGKHAAADESATSPQAASPASAAPAPENHPVQTTEPASKPVAKKKSDDTHQQAPLHAPASSPGSSAGMTKQPEPGAKQLNQDKAVTEKEQPANEKKARVASDKKKKPAKPQTESQLPAEDVFLSPVPLPSKPAAIGGSGG